MKCYIITVNNNNYKIKWNKSTPNANRDHYNRGIDDRKRILTTLSPSTTHLKMANRLNTYHILHPKQLTDMVETVISQTTHTKELKIEDTHTTPHHSDHQIQYMTNKAITIEGYQSQVTGFMVLVYLNSSRMPSITPT